MEKLVSHSETIGKGLVGLGAIAVGIDCYTAWQKNEDYGRVIAKWEGGMQGAAIGAEGAIIFTEMVVTALTGISGELVSTALVATPYGWVALAIIAGVGAYVGSQYGEEFAGGLWDLGTKASEVAGQVIKDSWSSICAYAKRLWEGKQK